MTREEAIALLNEQYETCKRIYDCSADQRKSYPNVPQFMEALSMALSALRPVSREQVERMRGEWIVKHDKYNEITITECSKCGDETVYEFFFEENDSNFCPHCGAPMTDEAVQMVMERINEMEKMKK